MTSIADEIVDFIKNACGVREAHIAADTPLFSSGLLDSFSLVEVVCFIEERLGIKIRARDLHLCCYPESVVF